MQNSILEFARVVEQDHILKKRKLSTKEVPETVRTVFISKFICDHL